MSLDDYEILTVIGRGSYAKVVQAEHKKTGQIYAIKIIKKVNKSLQNLYFFFLSTKFFFLLYFFLVIYFISNNFLLHELNF